MKANKKPEEIAKGQVSLVPLANKMAVKRLEGLTQTQICLGAGVHQSRMSNILRGKLLPSVNDLIKLCIYFQCTLNDLMEVNLVVKDQIKEKH